MKIKNILPTDTEWNKIKEFVESFKNSSAFNDHSNQFYGKVINYGSFFADQCYHPDIDAGDKQLYDNADWLIKQIREDDIGSKVAEMTESVRSTGVKDRILLLSNTDPNATFKGLVFDGCSKTIVTRNLEHDGVITRKPMRAGLVKDHALIKFLRKWADEVRLAFNNHLPASENSAEDIKAAVGRKINAADKETVNSKEFKASLAAWAYHVCDARRAESTVKKWVQEALRRREQQEQGIRSYRDEKYRRNTIKKALDAGVLLDDGTEFSIDSDTWTDENSFEHNEYKVYLRTPTAGMTEKIIGQELLRRKTNNSPSIKSVVITLSKKTKSVEVYKDSKGVMEKLDFSSSDITNKQSLFDYVFQLGQLVNYDEGTLNTCEDCEKEIKKLTKDDDA